MPNSNFRPLCSSLLLTCLLACAVTLGGSNMRALTIGPVTSDNGYPAHEVQWTDADGFPRSAILVDQNATGSGPYTGYLRQYTYQVNGVPRVCTGTENYATGGDLEFSGDGFIQNHTADGGDFSSGNGAGFPGTTTITLQGSSHAIITYSIPTYTISGQTVPATVQWFFADGRSHPVFVVSQDARATPGNLGADTRSPYGDMAYDGAGVDALVGGYSYGDTYKFVTLAAKPEQVTNNSPWQDTQANSIPYTMQWAEPATVDAEMGHVATLPISLSDQGQDTQTSTYDNDLFDPRSQEALAGPLPPIDTQAYQIVQYSLNGSDPTDSKRLAWGSNFGRVGGFDNYGDTTVIVTQYSQHSDDPLNQPLAGTRVDGLLMAYSTFVVFGPHSGSYLAGAVGQTVGEMENSAAAMLSAATGTVVASGPAAAGAAANTTIAYSPAGYNPTYAVWEVAATGNAVNATLTPAAGLPLTSPVFLVDNYTSGQLPDSISINGNSTPGSDYYATLDVASQRLWITANVSTAAAIKLVVVAPTGTPPPPPPPVAAPVISSAASASGQVGQPFSYQIVATNSPTGFAATNLPPGLTVDPVAGLISGTPTQSGSFAVGLTATNAGGSGTATLALVVSPATPATSAPVITSAATASAQEEVPFTYQIVATNSPTSFAAANLPTGLTVDPVGGLISGVPTESGSFAVGLTATNSIGSGTATLALVILPATTATGAPVIMSAAGASAQTGVAFTYQIVATNSPTSFSAANLPAGLSVNTANGLISGTPTQSGSFSVVLTAANSAGNGTATLTLVVSPAAPATGAPVITSAAGASAAAGVAFTYQIAATNSPTSFGASGLPAGLTVNPTTGLISGTPKKAGTYAVALSASSGAGTGTAILDVKVALPVITLMATIPKVKLGSGDVGEFTLALSAPQAHVITVKYTLAGTAVDGTDYVFLKGSKELQPGQTRKTLKIVPKGTLRDAQERTVRIALDAGTGYTVGTSKPIKIKIVVAP